MRSLLQPVFMFCCVAGVFGQTVPSTKLSEYLKEVKASTSAHRALWNIDLYGPILFVDPVTRDAFGSEKDSAGVLTNHGDIFRGKIPGDRNIANTSMKWNGKLWAMILLPLSANRNERLNLITHELFHRAQPALEFKSLNVDNNHLDKQQGRIYLRLELEALRQAVESQSREETITHVTSALMFRKMRHNLYPDADSTENLLELNEGLAEYTGLMMSDRSEKEMKEHLSKSVKEFQQNKTYVRSFAYQTIPLYGYITHKLVREFWNRDITMKTNLTEYFITSFSVKIPDDLETFTAKVWLNYKGEQILNEEQQRADANLKLVDELIAKFVTNPHLEIGFEQMNVSFNPGNLIPLDHHGTVYPTMRITDNWGILTVEDGALLSGDWKKVTLTLPEENDSRVVKGKGWKLELNSDQYEIIRDKASSNYILSKKRRP